MFVLERLFVHGSSSKTYADFKAEFLNATNDYSVYVIDNSGSEVKFKPEMFV